jgi:hypothetical protein
MNLKRVCEAGDATLKFTENPEEQPVEPYNLKPFPVNNPTSRCSEVAREKQPHADTWGILLTLYIYIYINT